jgi:Glycosyl hydrolases family 35
MASANKESLESSRSTFPRCPDCYLRPVGFAQRRPEPKTFKVVGDHFELDGKPFQALSGEIHYTRIPRAYWRDSIRMARAMGLNTIGSGATAPQPQPQ